MHPWQIAVVAAGAALVGAGCAGEVDPTPTQPPPGEPPGEGQVVGAVVIANGVGYDLTTGQLGPPDIAGAAITAGFVSPGGGADATDALPVPVGLPDEGVAVESCVYWDPVAAAQGAEERSAPADDPGLGALISVGDFITLSYGGAAIEVPLVTEDDLPPQLEGQPLPPLYLKTGEAFDPSLYAAEPLDVTVAGSDVLAGFTAQSLVTPPAHLSVASPDLTAEPVLDPAVDLPITWDASQSDWVVIDLRATSGPGLSCLVVDDGAFTIPASDLAQLPEGEAVLTVARVRAGWAEIRQGEWLVAAGCSGVSGRVSVTSAGRASP